MTTTPPLPAATVLVIRDGEPSLTDEVEVLLVRRSHRASFMANAYVFPGGRVDAADAAGSTAGLPTEGLAGSATRRAAARELREEVSLQVDDLAQLVPFAHWITPSAEPKRFDTAFFLWALVPPAPSFGAARPAQRPEVQVDGREVFDPLWITPAAALDRYAEGTLNLPPPTVCTLEDLAAEIAAARTAEPPAALLQTLLTRCAARRPLPVLPKFFADSAGTLAIVMPWDAEYSGLPGEGGPLPALADQAAPVARRIRRCLLQLEGAGKSYAAARPTDQAAPAVPWTVERLAT
jgi:8-oxo-dGTP pyrophosphatase MutT (NUDIX family)